MFVWQCVCNVRNNASLCRTIVNCITSQFFFFFFCFSEVMSEPIMAAITGSLITTHYSPDRGAQVRAHTHTHTHTKKKKVLLVHKYRRSNHTKPADTMYRGFIKPVPHSQNVPAAQMKKDAHFFTFSDQLAFPPGVPLAF